jgi:hypothetical protein
LIIVGALAALVGGLIFFNIIGPAEAFHWDEGHHTLYGTWIYRDLAGGDWDRFWADTHHQAYWCFLHSWLLGAFFLLFGLSFQSARALSLVFFFLTTLLVYLISIKFFSRAGWKIGLLAAFACLTSPLMIAFSAQSMLEGLGALVFLSAVYLYFQSAETKQWYWYALFGLVLGLSIVTKYNYALFILSSSAVVILAELPGVYRELKGSENIALAGKNKRKEHKQPKKIANPFYPWLYKNLVIAAPVVLIALWWFLGPESERKIAMLLQTGNMISEPNVIGFWQNVIYYPRAIMTDGFSSPWFGLLAVLAIFVPLAVLKEKKIAPLAIIVLVVWAISTFSVGAKFIRHFHNVLPVVFILFAASVFAWTELLTERLQKYRLTAGIVLLVLLVPAVLSLTALPALYGGEDVQVKDFEVVLTPGSPNMTDVLAFYRQNMDQNKSFATAVSLNVLSPYSYFFYFRDWPVPFYTRFGDYNDPNFFMSEYYLTLELAPDSRYLKAVQWDSINEWNTILKRNLRAGRIRLYKEQEFAGTGVKALIYRKVGGQQPRYR